MTDHETARFDEAQRFIGHEPNECGVHHHRTTGRRAWCLACHEWCYPAIPCHGCEIPTLRDQRDRAVRALAETYAWKPALVAIYSADKVLAEPWAQAVLDD